jgi:predicted transcriptional regulator
MFSDEPDPLYDSTFIRRRYRILAESPKPVLAIFKLLETKGPLPVRELIQLSGYKKSRVYEALKLMKSRGIIETHRGLCYLPS